jgi:hypothetical protein
MRRKVYIYINVEDQIARGSKVYSKVPPTGPSYKTLTRFFYSNGWISNDGDIWIDPLRIEDIPNITIQQLTTELNTKFNIAPPSYVKVIED